MINSCDILMMIFSWLEGTCKKGFRRVSELVQHSDNGIDQIEWNK